MGITCKLKNTASLGPNSFSLSNFSCESRFFPLRVDPIFQRILSPSSAGHSQNLCGGPKNQPKILVALTGPLAEDPIHFLLSER